MSLLEHIVPSKLSHKHTIIFLHGKDSTATEFASELFESQASNDLTLPESLPHVKWVFPSAPTIYSARFDCHMSQWFDMWDVQQPHERSEGQVVDLVASIATIVKLVDRESATVGWENVVLGGISQGAGVAFYVAHRRKCAGLIGLSAWLPFRPQIDRLRTRAATRTVTEAVGREVRSGEELSLFEAALRLASGRDEEHVVRQISGLAGHCRDLPVFLTHCEDDQVVSIVNGYLAGKTLEQLGAEVIWCSYAEGGHWLNEPQGMDDMLAFMRRFWPTA
ncbi:Acyl-protein thioesterase 1 [Sphaceloma murrayae]|uniref:Acyl-protein thioesterase 1 n=1 Tax=Sphaceloma murrayae TaxID=2082308 RepID=A0A2K1QMU2_9PEZI|nr:Acyl-protein thioesterase 1 [Sphaceloma murrayae]